MSKPFTFPLNDRQQEAALHVNGPCLVLAGAGTGKTRVITERICRLIEVEGFRGSEILAVTFTNKAAKEMRERVREMIGKVRSKGLTIATFHAFAASILRENIDRLGYKKHYSIYGTADQLRLLRDLANEAGIGSACSPDEVLWHISDAKNNLIPPEKFKPRPGNDASRHTATLYPLYQRALRAFNAIDFDDMIMLAVRLLEEIPSLKRDYGERFRQIMVDEYQDTNLAQYRLLQLLAQEHRNLFVVGDDDQSIYGWRGANLGNILEFERDFPGTRTVRLEQNYRSTGFILKAANAVIARNITRKEKALWTSAGDGESITYHRCIDEIDEAERVVEQIHALRHREGYALNDFAILYRTNTQSRAFEEQLRYENIPYVLIGGQKFFDRKEVKDAVAYLKVLLNPSDDINLLRILNYPKRGIGDTTAQRLISISSEAQISLWETMEQIDSHEEFAEKTRTAIRDLVSLITRYRQRFLLAKEPAGIGLELFETLDLKGEIYRQAADPKQAKKRAANLEEVVNAMTNYQERETSPSLAGFLDRISLLDDSDTGRKDKEKLLEQDAVTLMSLHSSKGLEFPVVFLVGFEEEFMPHRKTLDAAVDVDEERRLLYVGITRARKHLYLMNAARRKKYGRLIARIPSRFLDEIPEQLLRTTDSEAAPDPSKTKERAASFFAGIQALLGDNAE